jgi:hypothetical protein
MAVVEGCDDEERKPNGEEKGQTDERVKKREAGA